MPILSAYMITLNEERRLPVTLRALTQVADEIIVVDAGSTDRTREIAASFGAFVYEREWDNYSAQKRYAESLCKGDWLINVDADEEISPELVREILYAIGEETYQVLRVHIIDIFPGHKKPNRLVRHYNVIRLYKRGYASMGETYTCDRVAFLRDDARVGQLDSLIYHRSFINIHQTVSKYNDYTDQQMETIKQEGKRYSSWRMVFTMSLTFFKYFVLHRQFLYGFWGFINAVNLSYARFLKFAKYYELQMKEREKVDF